MGVDFEIEYDDGEGDLMAVTDLEESAGPSNRGIFEEDFSGALRPGRKSESTNEFKKLKRTFIISHLSK